MSLAVVKDKRKSRKIGKIEIKWIENIERKESFQPVFSNLHWVIDQSGYSNCTRDTWVQGYQTFFMLNTAEHEIKPAYKC